MKKNLSRYLAAILTSAMVLTSLTPMGAYAAEADVVLTEEIQEEAVGGVFDETAAAEETAGASQSVVGEAADGQDEAHVELYDGDKLIAEDYGVTDDEIEEEATAAAPEEEALDAVSAIPEEETLEPTGKSYGVDYNFSVGFDDVVYTDGGASAVSDFLFVSAFNDSKGSETQTYLVDDDDTVTMPSVGKTKADFQAAEPDADLSKVASVVKVKTGDKTFDDGKYTYKRAFALQDNARDKTGATYSAGKYNKGDKIGYAPLEWGCVKVVPKYNGKMVAIICPAKETFIASVDSSNIKQDWTVEQVIAPGDTNIYTQDVEKGKNYYIFSAGSKPYIGSISIDYDPYFEVGFDDVVLTADETASVNLLNMSKFNDSKGSETQTYLVEDDDTVTMPSVGKTRADFQAAEPDADLSKVASIVKVKTGDKTFDDGKYTYKRAFSLQDNARDKTGATYSAGKYNKGDKIGYAPLEWGCVKVAPKFNAIMKAVITPAKETFIASVDSSNIKQDWTVEQVIAAGDPSIYTQEVEKGKNYYIFSAGSKPYINYISLEGVFPYLDWDDVPAPTVSVPDNALSADGKSVKVNWTGVVGRIGDFRYSDSVEVHMCAAKDFPGTAVKQDDVLDSKTSLIATQSGGDFTFNPPFTGDYYFDIRLRRMDGTFKDCVERANFPNYVYPMEAPASIVVNGLGYDSNGETVGVGLVWGEFKEADSYNIYFKEKGASEWLPGYPVNHEASLGTTKKIHGLTPGKDYVVAITAIRTLDLTGRLETTEVLERDVDSAEAKDNGNPIQIEASTKVTKSWTIKGFGTGASKTPWNGETEFKNNAGSKGLWYSVNSKKVADDGLSASDGAITLAAVGDSGKIQDSTHDGILFYYTAIDAKTENFTLSANVHVDKWSGGTGQEGFGIGALDRVPGFVTKDETGDGKEFWNNEILVGSSKMQFCWDADEHEITSASPSSDNNVKTKIPRIGPGLIVKTGITKSMIDANLSSTEMGNGLKVTRYSASEAPGWAHDSGEHIDQNCNLVGNVYDKKGSGTKHLTKYVPEDTDNNLAYYPVRQYTDFKMTLRRHNSGYLVEIVSSGEDIDPYTGEPTGKGIVSETRTIKYFNPGSGDPMLQVDKDAVYVGFWVARNAQMTVSDYNLTLVSPKNDTEVPVEYEKVNPDFKMTSDLASTTPGYKLTFLPNAAGELTITKVNNKTGKESNVIRNRITGQNELVSVGTSLAKGNNTYKWYYKPTNPAPKKDDPNQVSDTYVPASTENLLKTYEQKEGQITVKYGVLKTTSAKNKDGKKINKVLYVAPDGAFMNVDGEWCKTLSTNVLSKEEQKTLGTKDNPYALQDALNFAMPGYTLYLTRAKDKGFTFKQTTVDEPFEVFRLVSGTQTQPITLTVDPEETGRPVLDAMMLNEGFRLRGSYWNISGFDITNSKESEEGIQVAGSYNTIEDMEFYRNRGSGMQISKYGTGEWPSNNLVKNCSSYINADASGADADGYGAKLTCGEGNVFDNCIAAWNADDGWDFYAKEAEIGAVTLKNCVAFLNGFRYDYNGNFEASGNGNGFKMGGNSLPGKHRIINSIAFLNKAKGIDANHCPDIIVTNCTSFDNASYNVNLETDSWPSTNFNVNGVVSFRDQEAYGSEDLDTLPKGKALENWAYQVMNESAANKFGQKLRDYIELRTPQKNGTDPDVYGEKNFYSFGDGTFHNGVEDVNDKTVYVTADWFENIDYFTAVYGFILSQGAEKFGFSEAQISELEVKYGGKGMKRLPNGTIDFDGFLALKIDDAHPERKNTGATLATTSDVAAKQDSTLSENSLKEIMTTGIHLEADKDTASVNAALMYEGQKKNYTAYVNPKNANKYNVIKWYSENEYVATVSTKITTDSYTSGKSTYYYDVYHLTVAARSAGKTKIVGETGNGKKVKIAISVFQDENLMLSGVVTKPSVSVKSVTLNSASLVPVTFKITNGVDRKVQSAVLTDFKKGKLVIANDVVQKYFDLAFDTETGLATVSLRPYDIDYGKDAFGKRTYKVSDDDGYARKGTYKGNIRVKTVDSESNEIYYTFKFKIKVNNKKDQPPVTQLIHTADLSKGIKEFEENDLTNTKAGSESEEPSYAYATYRLTSDKPVSDVFDAVKVVSRSQPSEIEKLAYLQRPAKMRFAYYALDDFELEKDSEGNTLDNSVIVRLALMGPSNGQGATVGSAYKGPLDKSLSVYVKYADGTSGMAKINVMTRTQPQKAFTGTAAKKQYSAAGTINMAVRGISCATVNFGNLALGKVTLSSNDASGNFEIRPADDSRNTWSIFAKPDKALDVGKYVVKATLYGADGKVIADEVPINVNVIYNPAAAKADPKKVSMVINSGSVIKVGGSTPTKKWAGYVDTLSCDNLLAGKDHGGRDRILLRAGTYKNVKIGKTGNTKASFTLSQDIKVGDILVETLDENEKDDGTVTKDTVTLVVKSLSDSSITSKISDYAAASDEEKELKLKALYQRLPRQAALQYTVGYEGQNRDEKHNSPEAWDAAYAKAQQKARQPFKTFNVSVTLKER